LDLEWVERQALPHDRGRSVPGRAGGLRGGLGRGRGACLAATLAPFAALGLAPRASFRLLLPLDPLLARGTGERAPLVAALTALARGRGLARRTAALRTPLAVRGAVLCLWIHAVLRRAAGARTSSRGVLEPPRGEGYVSKPEQPKEAAAGGADDRHGEPAQRQDPVPDRPPAREPQDPLAPPGPRPA